MRFSARKPSIQCRVKGVWHNHNIGFALSQWMCYDCFHKARTSDWKEREPAMTMRKVAQRIPFTPSKTQAAMETTRSSRTRRWLHRDR